MRRTFKSMITQALVAVSLGALLLALPYVTHWLYSSPWWMDFWKNPLNKCGLLFVVLAISGAAIGWGLSHD